MPGSDPETPILDSCGRRPADQTDEFLLQAPGKVVTEDRVIPVQQPLAARRQIGRDDFLSFAEQPDPHLLLLEGVDPVPVEPDGFLTSPDDLWIIHQRVVIELTGADQDHRSFEFADRGDDVLDFLQDISALLGGGDEEVHVVDEQDLGAALPEALGWASFRSGGVAHCLHERLSELRQRRVAG